MNAPESRIIPAIGEPFAGGILLGRFFLADKPLALIGAPKAELKALRGMAWNTSMKRVEGALSVYDGLANTEAMAAAGSGLAKTVRALRIDGRDDWYLWSRGEALLAYAADLKRAEAFEETWHWTSTQYASVSDWAWYQSFNYGTQYHVHKSYEYSVFAVRRVPIQ